MKVTEILSEAVKQRLDPKCWKGKHKEGTKIKGGVRVNNCVPNESMSEADELRARGGLAAVNKKPRPGQTDMRDIPVGNHPGARINKFTDKDREEQPGRLKAAIKSTLGKHTRPNLPEQGVAEGLADTQQKIQDTINKLEDRLKHAKTDEQWDRISARIERLQAGLKRSKQGVAEVSQQTLQSYRKKAAKQKSDALDVTDRPDTDDATWVKNINIAGKRKDGIAAANKRLGLGEEKLDKIRDKHDKYDEGIDDLARVLELSGLNLTADEQFDIIEEMVEQLAEEHGVDAEQIWEDFESVEDDELLESAAWRRSEGKSKKGGLNAKGVASYRRENPGSKLQTAVTTKPSKLKAGSKAAKRRKSFCARMGGVKGPMKKPNGKPTRKALALRKWNC